MAVNSQVKAVRVAGINTALLTGGYDVIDASGLSHSCFKIRITNESNIDVGISFDGVSTNDIILADSVYVLDLQMNSQPTGNVALMAKGTKVYVIAPAPGVGDVWLAGYYQV